MHPWTVVAGVVLPYTVRFGVPYQAGLAVFSCQDPEGAGFELHLVDWFTGEVLARRTGLAPVVSSPTWAFFANVPAPSQWGVYLWTDGRLTDLGFLVGTVEDTYPEGRTRAQYDFHSVPLFPVRGSSVPVTVYARNLGKTGYLLAAVHGRGLYTLEEVVPWTFGDWQWVASGGSASWSFSFTMPDRDVILDYAFYSYDPDVGESVIDEAGYLNYLLEDSPRSLTATPDRVEVRPGETFTVTGRLTRGGTPVNRSPIWLMAYRGGWQWLKWAVADAGGNYGFTVGAGELAEGENRFKTAAEPTYPGNVEYMMGILKVSPRRVEVPPTAPKSLGR